jgi:hypothetical protein
MDIGTKVRTAEQLSAAPVNGAACRRPGRAGVVRALPEGEGGAYKVRHNDGSAAYYHEHELTPVHAVPTVPEQLAALQEAMASELNGLDERLTALEQGEAPEAAPARSTLEAYRALHRTAKAWRDWRMLAPMGGSARQEHEAPIIDAVQVLDESAELRDILAGGATDRPLAELASEAMRLAGPVKRLLSAHGENEIRWLVGGLAWWGKDSAHSIAGAVAQTLSAIIGDLVVLRPGEPDRGPEVSGR